MPTRMRRVAALSLLMMVSLTGCGGDSEPPTLKNLAAQVGCSGLDDSGEGEMFTRESGSCTLDDQTIYLNTFSDADQQQQWIDVATSMGGGGIYVKGDLWVATVDEAGMADAIAKDNDGKVVN